VKLIINLKRKLDADDKKDVGFLARRNLRKLDFDLYKNFEFGKII
jgi:hypothetical protein